MGRPKIRDGQSQANVWMPNELWERLEGLMARTRRSMTVEILHAIERHVEQPPEVVTPKLKPAQAEAGEKKKRQKKPAAGPPHSA